MPKKAEKQQQKKKQIVVATSGGFDPLHIGHVRLFQEAKKLGDKLVVILNNDNWILKKKGYVFMPQQERKEIIEAIRGVDEVVFTKHGPNPSDMSVCEDLRALKPDIVAKGGDRDVKDSENKSSTLNPEKVLCDKLGIQVVFNVGRGGKVQSSSWLVDTAAEKKRQK